MCRQLDQPMAALVQDLKQRGLLEDTLVIWGGEFGRTPVAQPQKTAPVGRDHLIEAFSMWMVGGGVKPGVDVGRTDELGFHAAEERHYVTDIHATVLHQMGLESARLEIPGRKRLERDVGEVMHKILV